MTWQEILAHLQKSLGPDGMTVPQTWEETKDQADHLEAFVYFEVTDDEDLNAGPKTREDLLLVARRLSVGAHELQTCAEAVGELAERWLEAEAALHNHRHTGEPLSEAEVDQIAAFDVAPREQFENVGGNLYGLAEGGGK